MTALSFDLKHLCADADVGGEVPLGRRLGGLAWGRPIVRAAPAPVGACRQAGFPRRAGSRADAPLLGPPPFAFPLFHRQRPRQLGVDAAQPLPVQGGHRVGVHPGSAHDLPGHDEARVLPVHARAGVDLDAAGGGGPVHAAFGAHADELDQAAGHGAEVVGRVAAGAQRDALLGQDLAQLVLDVLDLAHGAGVQEMALAEARPVAGALESVVDLEVGQEVAQRVTEGVVRLAGLHLLARGQDEGGAAGEEADGRPGTPRARQGSAGSPPTRMRENLGRIGKASISLPDRRELPVLVQGLQGLQGLDGREDAGAAGRGDEVEALEVPDAQLGHAQHHLGQVRAVDLLGGEQRPGLVVPPGVQAAADPRARAPRPAAALVGRGLGDGHLDQRGSEVLVVVVVHLGQAGVDHRGDPVDGHAGLGDVGGHDHLDPAGVVVEHPLLLLGGQSRVQRQDRQPAGESAGPPGGSGSS